MLLTVGFAFGAIDTEPAVDLDVADVSSASGSQIEAYVAIDTTAVKASAVGTADDIEDIINTNQSGNVVFYLKITNEGVASLDSRGADIVNAPLPVPNPAGWEIATPSIRGADLHIHDLSITQYDKLGISLGEYISAPGSKIEHRSDAVRDGRNFMVTLDETDVSGDAAFMTVQLPKNKFQHAAPADVRAAHFDADKSLKWNTDSNVLTLELVKAEPEPGDPLPVSLVRAADTITRGADQGATGVFSRAAVSGPFNVKVTFTEEPHGSIKDIIHVKRGKVTGVIKGTPFYVRPDVTEGNYDDSTNTVPLTTGRDRRYHSYLLTITPDLKKGDETVEIAVNKFDDMVLPANSWSPPANLSLAHNRYLLIVPVAQDVLTDIFEPAATDKPSNEVFISEGLVIPAGGYLVLTQGDADQSGVTGSPAKIADKKLPAQKLYNITNKFAFPAPGNDLEALLRVGGTIRLLHKDIAENKPTDAEANDNGYLVSNTAYTAGSVVISEVMWGRDLSLGDANSAKSQWIELHNPGTEDISIDKNEWTLAFYQGPAGTAGADVIDEVSNATPYWPAPGSSGATQDSRIVNITGKGKVEAKDDDPFVTTEIENFELSTLQSMYRKIDGTDVMSGTSGDSWAASTIVGSRNLSGFRAGTPGAATPYTTPPPEPEPEPEPPTPVPAATASDLRITEIMVVSNDGKLPQWIEITNTSTGEVSLDDWVVGIDNDPTDANVVSPALGIKLDGVTLDAGQAVLVVSKTTNRNSGVEARTEKDRDANAGALDSNRIVDAQQQVNPPSAQYSLLSEIAFRISLEAPLPLAGGVTDRGDVVGNLGGGWELPMSEEGRSSMIRYHEMDKKRSKGKAIKIMGTDAAAWMLASNTGLGGAYVATYYGDKDDVGTPGYDAGGALPVELSTFGAKRDPLTGQVIITWETQSELNNAGFFIKRSQQKNGNFVAINAAMIAGAGTTSEKQSYTYTDTTAQPNIVYYYQIEDVSLDGNRQTLTRAHRLKGHIGAAGKATTTWGELKTSLDQ